ncbi:kynureninase [alpha proteobacterium AAP81b]|nr:kynureninase [alpha proteobacterium AAP81b]
MTPEQLDAADELAFARDLFALPEGVIYLDGNSLGPLPHATTARLSAVIAEEWGGDLITSWNRHDWIGAPARVGAKIAPLIGAAADEVIVADSVSVNLFKLLAGALAMRPGRRRIVVAAGDFPTDLYMAQGIASLGLAEVIAADDPVAALDDRTAVLLLSQVNYKTAALADMATVTAAAHRAGALVLWDLSHSVGALPVDLGGAGADLAVGCGYKYLNGGPGAPAFAFVARRHQADFRQPLSGWMGHAAPFAFAGDYEPAPGIGRLACGTPPILSLMALEVGVELIAGLGVDRLAAKSRALTELFITAVADIPGLTLASPMGPRGSHLAFRHPNAYAICQALIARGVIGDFRDPDILRFGFAPAYLRFADVAAAAAILAEIVATGAWDRPEFHARQAVT